MTSPPLEAAADLAAAVDRYRQGGSMADLLGRLDAVAARTPLDSLIAAAEPYRDLPEVIGPLYEKVVAARPADARALVVLGGAYWLSGRGPEVVGELASRAIASDPEHRGAWHLWALTESDPRDRVARWQQVVARFSDDELARANLADNAASLAGAESDADALALAVHHYEVLLERAAHPGQREALEAALCALRGTR